MKRGDKGSEVQKLQLALIELGFALPRWGADSSLGGETLTALTMLLNAHGRTNDENPTEVSAEELAFVYALRDLLRRKGAHTPDNFVDRRQFAARTHDYGRRAWPTVTGICLHQTACMMGERDGRYDAIGCHVVVCRSGKVLWMHDFDRLIEHGNGWNTRTVGIEFDGLYAGIEGDPKTVWDDPSTARRELAVAPTPEALEAGRQLCRWIVAEVARRGGGIKSIVAHRQASENRRNDPGSAIWQGVAVPLHTELGLSDGGIGFKLGTGYAIPEVWDARCKGYKY